MIPVSRLFLIAVVAVTILPSSLLADRRNYAWTYQYMTMPEGATELEFYQTTRVPKEGPDSWEYRLEVEQGLTDRWDFSVYQIFTQQEDQQLRWDAVQFRTRYRIGEEDQYLLDPLVYLEYRRKVNSDHPDKVEAKLILAKTVDRFNISFNPLYEYFFVTKSSAPEPDVKHEIGIDVGTSWEFSPVFSLGLESVTRTEFKDTADESASVTQSYLGPTVSFAKGEWWYTISALAGVTDLDRTDQYRVRFLMGVGL